MMILSLLLGVAAAAVSQPVPKAPVQSLITPADYPEPARARGLTGTMRVALDISPIGRVARCRRLESAGTPILDAATCRLLISRARFQPAQDAQGQAVFGVYEASVSWPPR